MKFPALFVSHGAPTFAVEPGQAGPLLNAIGERVLALPGLRAVLVISPHWRTRGLRIGASARPQTIHDFGGFPASLYALHYPVEGAPDVAREVAELLTQSGLSAQLVDEQGLDHGAWVPLMHMLPGASVPVFQLSLPIELRPADALALGSALAPLREQGVLVVGSGSLTHNLYEFRQSETEAPEDYVREFVQWARRAAIEHDVSALVDFRGAPHGRRAHPSDEHYLPLLVAAGTSSAGEPVEVIEGGVTYGVLSMEGYVFGELPGVSAAA
ncbi:Aromatic ring-opening dioxygenase, catalytic subunit, LigB family [Variovorax sp. OK605]|jgi:4,5-DOPA dioxygenase extradiol|uniref:dioxygenase family protein n=1 Tax=Variovorax sp. OK605 TaxID=1855317 RepID=UPI0008E364F8|nr:class III extradiol ring-cleavage dioxygenase [Variovorax sp. OK605]SFO90803.1 Aromatic ring-opening dioxygenase, catalytic subunit, LigB family [Variovorax sp. OK605]